MADEKVDHKKVWAHGYYTAMRELGEPKTMNLSKADAAYRNQTTIAKKVFDATPAAECWTSNRIVEEMKRLGSGSGDLRIVLGCMNTLIDAGLVIEPEKGRFKRAMVRQKVLKPAMAFPDGPTPTLVPTDIEPKEPPPMQPTKPVVQLVEKLGPIDRLSLFAKRLRDLANDMETAALDLTEQSEKNEIETAKMRQLQALLKSIN